MAERKKERRRVPDRRVATTDRRGDSRVVTHTTPRRKSNGRRKTDQ